MQEFLCELEGRVMDILRVVRVIALLVAAYLGLRWFLSPHPLHSDPRLPTFDQVTHDLARQRFENSYVSDGDAVRDRLRQAVLESANVLADDPCNETLKRIYIGAVIRYARAWISAAPCLVGENCYSDAHYARVDLAAKAFGSPLDLRVRDAMKNVHGSVVFTDTDFPKDVLILVSELASDPAINPHATAKFKQLTADLRGKRSCS